MEWNIGLLAGNSHDRYYEIPYKQLKNNHLASEGAIEKITKISLVDLWQKLRVSFIYDQETSIWRFPIETVSLSEGGFEKVYQNSVVLSHWQFDLGPNQEKTISFTHEIEKIK